MNKCIVIVAAGGLALLGLAGCFYPPDTLPVPSGSTEFQELPLTAAERDQLRSLHQLTLKRFLEVPMNGFSRMMPPPYVVPSDVLVSTPPAGAPANNPGLNNFQMMNVHNGKNPLKVNLTKSLRVDPAINGLKLEDLGVRFEQVQLLGIAKQPEPTIFDIKDDTPADIRPTRPLDAFEQRGLDRLQANSWLYVESVQGKMRVLAPIYAGASCVSCHTKQGELLGAFSYTLAATGTKVFGQ